MSDDVLHFRRVPGGGMDGELIELAGDGDGRLRFEVEVVLSAVDETPFQDVLRRGEGGGDVAAPDGADRTDELPAPLRLVDGEDRLQALDVDGDRFLRRADGGARLGGDDHD